MSWSNVYISCAVIGVTLLLTFLLSKPIGAYQLGEAYAQSMGVNIKFFRVALILLSSILSATVTAFAGPISFVGIAVPFLMKRSFGTSGAEYQYRYLHLWSTCCYFHDVAEEERKLKWIITIFIWITFLSVMTKRP